MSGSRGHVGESAVRLGFVLALGAVLAAAQDLRADAGEPEHESETLQPFARPAARPRLELVPAPALAPAPAAVEEPAVPSETPIRLRWAKRAAQALLLVAVVATWAWFLLPQSLGGRASWVLVSGKSMLPTYHTGDLVLVRKQSSYHVGEVIAYLVPKGDPMAGLQVIHRIIGGDAVHGFVVQGDNRTAPDSWRPKPQDIVGAKLLRVPYGVVVIQNLRSPLMLGLLAASFVFVYMLTAGRGGKGPEDEATAEVAADAAERRAA